MPWVGCVSLGPAAARQMEEVEAGTPPKRRGGIDLYHLA